MAKVKRKRRATSIDAYVGSRIRFARTMRGWTQTDLGERLKISYQQIQKYESGANRVSAGQLFRLTEILDVPVTFFYDDMPKQIMGGSGKKPPPGDPGKAREQGKLLHWFSEIENAEVRSSVIAIARAMAEAGGATVKRGRRPGS